MIAYWIDNSFATFSLVLNVKSDFKIFQGKTGKSPLSELSQITKCESIPSINL